MRSKPVILFLVIILVSCQSIRNKNLYEQKLQAFEVFTDSLKSVQLSSFSDEKINQAIKHSHIFQKALEELSDTKSRNYITPTTDQLVRYRQAMIDIRQVLVNWKESKDAQSSSTEIVSKKPGDISCIRVTQNSNNLQLGQEVVITVESCQSFKMHKVLINGASVAISDKGNAKLSMPSGMIGTHNIPVEIVVMDKDGNLKTESYTVNYKVGKAPSQ